MADDGIIKRFVRVILDRASAKTAGDQLSSSLADAGQKGGENFLRGLRSVFDKRLAELKVKLAQGLIDPAQFKAQAANLAKEFNAGLVKGMADARNAGTLTDREYVKLARSLKTVGDTGQSAADRLKSGFVRAGAAIAAAFSFTKVLGFLRESVEAALEAEKSTTRLDAALRPLGRTYKEVEKQVESYLDTLMATTRFNDEDGREALANLVTATGDYNKALSLLNVTAQVAEKRQTTMAEAADVVVKASLGMTKGMTDLGIVSGQTGDIVAAIARNLGDLAEQAGGNTNSGKIARAKNLWGEFKEQIGLAILGTDTLQTAGEGLIGTLVDLTKWVKENKEDISALTSVVLGLAEAFVKAGGLIGKFFKGPGKLTIKQGPLGPHFGLEGGVFGEQPEDFSDVVSGTSSSATPTAKGGGRPPPPTKPGKLTDAQRDAKRDAEKLAGERERMARDIRVKTLMVEQQITKDFAEELVRRQEMLGQSTKATFGTLQEGYDQIDKLNLLLKAGFDNDVIPSVKQTERVITDLKTPVDNLNASMESLAANQPQYAEQFKTPWIDALAVLRNEVEGQGTLFADLGQAWAFGGFKGIIELAKYKVKENLARVIEEVAKAAGSFALGNPAAATAHLKSAAGHGAAAVAWKALAKAGGGGGSAGATGGGVGGGPGFNNSANAKPAETEVHIYLDAAGFDATNPVVQKVVMGSIENGKERYGNNVKVHRGTR